MAFIGRDPYVPTQPMNPLAHKREISPIITRGGQIILDQFNMNSDNSSGQSVPEPFLKLWAMISPGDVVVELLDGSVTAIHLQAVGEEKWIFGWRVLSAGAGYTTTADGLFWGGGGQL